jgi:hemerythrin-like metal-binding protein
MNIRWKKIYKTGFSEIDQWNRKLVHFINEFYSNILYHDINEHTGILIKKLIRDSEIHFLIEQSLLENSNCDNEAIQEHLGHHLQFLKKLQKTYFEFEGGNVLACYQLADYLRKWIIEHVMHYDRLSAEKSVDMLSV